MFTIIFDLSFMLQNGYQFFFHFHVKQQQDQYIIFILKLIWLTQYFDKCASILPICYVQSLPLGCHLLYLVYMTQLIASAKNKGSSSSFPSWTGRTYQLQKLKNHMAAKSTLLWLCQAAVCNRCLRCFWGECSGWVWILSNFSFINAQCSHLGFLPINMPLILTIFFPFEDLHFT